MKKTRHNTQRVQCLNEALCFEIRFFAKRQTVSGKAKRQSFIENIVPTLDKRS